MKCQYCKEKIPKNSNKCPKCNKPINKRKLKPNVIPIAICSLLVLILIIIMIIILLPNKQTVRCVTNQKQMGMNTNTVVIAEFKNDNIEKIKLNTVYKIGKSYASYIDTFHDQVKQNFDEYDKVEGIKVDIKKEKDKINVIVNTTKKGAEKLFNTEFDNQESAKAFIKAMESQEYKCK